MTKIKYDEEGNAYVIFDGNKIAWITNVPWIENLLSELGKDKLAEKDKNDI